MILTAILAIDFSYQIMVLADCRASWPNKIQDNLQKLYPLGPTGVLGFAGDISVAKSVLNHIKNKARLTPLPTSAKLIADHIRQWAKEAYDKNHSQQKPAIEFMYAAVDYGNVSLRTKNLNFAENIMVKMVSPEFELQHESITIRLGYAVNCSKDYILYVRNQTLGLATEPNGIPFQTFIAKDVFGNYLSQIGKSTVGGLFSIGVIDVNGVTWYGYNDGHFELKIEDGKFIQYDHKEGRRVPLKSVWEFDPYRPGAGNLIFQMAES